MRKKKATEKLPIKAMSPEKIERVIKARAKRVSKQVPQALIFPDHKNAISQIFPESGKVLLTGGGKEFVEKIGLEAIRKAVFSVLSGENLRTQTEPLSRRRIAQVSGAIVAMFTTGYSTIPDFQNKLSGLAIDQLRNSSGKANIWPAEWVIGLTDKLVQNVLKSDPAELESYVNEFEVAIKDAAKHCHEQLGNLAMTLGYIGNGKGEQISLDWEGIARLTTAIGAQTLAIRGSDKSMYGKLFERLVLGSVLTLLGFKRVDKRANKLMQGVFWLSDSSDDRESDATVIVSPGELARFDIGFIGPGNPEISKDKMSRYANVIEVEESSNSSVTFIVVDRLTQTVKTLSAAQKSGAEVIQMSMQYWPREIAIKLGTRFRFKHEIQDISDNELQAYIKKHLDSIQVQEFLKGVSVEEVVIEEIESDNTDVLEDD